MPSPRTAIIGAAAVVAAALGGSALAGAASNTTTSSSSTPAAAQSQQGGAPQGQPPAGAPGQPGGPGGPGGRHSLNGKTEQPLTGDTAAKVKAAALAKVPGTVERVETDVDHGSPYEAHVRKADGTEVEVLVDKDFQVTDTNTMQHP